MDIIDEFHKLYYHDGDEIYKKTYYMGIPIQKCPLDLWIYQEIIWEYKPMFIVETGTLYGGSALYLAHVLDNAKLNSQIYSIDINNWDYPKHNKIRYIWGDSVNRDLVDTLAPILNDGTVLVILDSLHTKEHVLKELELYSSFIKKDGYIIVEDTNLNGNPVRYDWGEGPKEAVEEFLSKHPEFVSDASKEKFLMTFNQQGYLKKIK